MIRRIIGVGPPRPDDVAGTDALPWKTKNNGMMKLVSYISAFCISIDFVHFCRVAAKRT